MHEAVVVTDLVKSYRRSLPNAVDALSFTVDPGEVFGLLGPNGAGKTTTVGVLSTRVLPTSGKALIHGVDVVRAPGPARQLLAVVPQRNNLDRSLSIRQNLLFHALYHGVGRAERQRRADEILDRMGLTDRANERLDFVSGGQAQRVMIARALMHTPKVLFLDEPSTGLDPQARLFVHERITELRREGVTVVLTTHDMDEAAKLCDRVGIVDHGKLLALDTPAALTRSLLSSTALTVTVSIDGHHPERLSDALSAVDQVERVERITKQAVTPAMPGIPGMPGGTPAPAAVDGNGTAQFRLYTTGEPSGVLATLLKTLTGIGCDLQDVSIGTPSLEDVFIHLTGRELR
ncbi:MAG TPA: ABC transporter ATP-binding protein [Pseudonocardiaceae bacterium]